MKNNLIAAIRMTLFSVVFLGIVYPALMVGAAYLLGPNHGAGETVSINDRTVGFAVVGQRFDSTRYFHGRPSAVQYNAAATGGSNKGPSNPAYLNEVEARIQDLLVNNPGLERRDIPVDLITASGSGIDPHISRAAASIQVSRIARARHLNEAVVRQLIDVHTEPPLWHLFGPERVNVLLLNIALDNL